MSTNTDTAATLDQGPGRSTWQDKLEPYLAIIGPLAMIAMILAFICLLYTSPSPRDKRQSRMPSSA